MDYDAKLYSWMLFNNVASNEQLYTARVLVQPRKKKTEFFAIQESMKQREKQIYKGVLLKQCGCWQGGIHCTEMILFLPPETLP